MSNPAPTYPLIKNNKPLLTPARHPLVAPTPKAVAAMLAEWEALEDAKPQPHLLPLTGFAALTLDVVVPHREEVIEELLEYGETDLLCYREAEVPALRECQQQEWQPWLHWAEARFGTQYHIAAGIVPVAQPSTNRAKHRAALEALSPWELACLAAVVKPATSLILGLAFLAGTLGGEELFHLSRLEEEENIRRWGLEEDAEERAENLRRDLLAAQRWRDLLLTEG